MYILPETELIKLNYQSKEQFSGVFVIEPLLPGFGMTIGNALRRILLSSLTGSAVTSFRIDGVTHEFTTLKGVKEDMVDLMLNLKALKVQLHGDEPAVAKLSKKGPTIVKVSDFQKNAQVEFPDKDYVIATLDKSANFNLEITVEKDRGYVPTSRRKDEKLPLGTIVVDAIFTPIKRVHYEVENTRVGGMTNYDKLTINMTTDGTIDPREAMTNAVNILLDHYNLIAEKIKLTIKDKKEPKKKTLVKSVKAISVKKEISKPVKKQKKVVNKKISK